MKKNGLKTIVKELQGASKMHLEQSKKIQGHIEDMKSPVNKNAKKVARKQVKLEKTNEQIVEKYKLDRDLKDKSTNRKINKYEKTEKQIKELKK